MGIRDILLLLEPPSRGQGATRFAISLANRMQARLTAVGVILDLAPPGSFVGDYPYEVMNEIMLRAKAEIESAYKNGVAASGVASDFRSIQAVSGEARARFARIARCHDIVVMRQPEHGASGDDELLVEAALFGSGRAVFMVPYVQAGNAKFEKALVAWDGSLPAARALAEAIPMLRRAELVEVVSVKGAGETEATPPSEVVRHLTLHGVKATGRLLPGDRAVGAMLLSYAADMGADYMVMGAYGHSRMREVILGGATRDILKGMTRPVLMAH